MKTVKTERFVFRATVDDRRAIEEISKVLERKQSDAVRIIIRLAHQSLCGKQS